MSQYQAQIQPTQELGLTPGVKFSSGRLGHMWSYVNGIAIANPGKIVCCLSTGASGTVITPQMAQALGVASEETAYFSTVGGMVESPVGRVRSMADEGVVVENAAVSINGFLPLGLLGQDCFGSYDVIIKQNAIEFRPR